MIEVLKQMTEALEANRPINYCENGKGERFPMFENNPFKQEANEQAIQAGKQAIAELESQEPFAWAEFDGEGGYRLMLYENNETYAEDWNKTNPNHIGWVEPIYKYPPQPEQEPVACERCKQLEEQGYDLLGKLKVANIKLSMRSQRIWVGLTYEEESELIRLAHNHAGIRFYIQAAEAKLKEKNT